MTQGGAERKRNLREQCWLTVKNAANRLICFYYEEVDIDHELLQDVFIMERLAFLCIGVVHQCINNLLATEFEQNPKTSSFLKTVAVGDPSAFLTAPPNQGSLEP